MQRDLIGAAQVRFLFGLPFAAMFLPMAQVVSLRMFREPPSLREALGMTLFVAAASNPCLDGGVRRPWEARLGLRRRGRAEGREALEIDGDRQAIGLGQFSEVAHHRRHAVAEDVA
jgi:hypothetical protein